MFLQKMVTGHRYARQPPPAESTGGDVHRAGQPVRYGGRLPVVRLPCVSPGPVIQSVACCRVMVPNENPYASPTPVDEVTVPRGGAFLTAPQYDEGAIVAEGTLSAEDYYGAQRLNRKSNRFLTFFMGLLLVAAAGGGLHLIFNSPPGPLLVAVGIVAVYLALATLLFPQMVARRMWRNSSLLREPVRRIITGDVVQSITATANVVLRWSMYSHYRRSETLVLLYLKEHRSMFTVIARRTFDSDEDWERFTAIVADKLPEQ